MRAVQVFYEGHVQGVGFRWTVKQVARGFDVTGFVRNRNDGRVELQVAGDESEVCGFLQAINESELAGHIRKTTEHALPEAPRFHGFQITHE